MIKMKTFDLVFLSSLLLLAVVSLATVNVEAQGQATVTIIDSIGGTTNPTPGTYQYNDGTSVTVTAVPTDSGFVFANWIISTNSESRVAFETPLTFTVASGSTYTIQAVFQVVQPIGVTNLPQNLSNAAVIEVLAAAGGTTSPPPGLYAFDNATSVNLTAVPDSGWTFSHWVISGELTSHGPSGFNAEPTDNPYNINHGYGARITYQAVFTQTNAPTPSPTIPELSAVALAIVLLAMVPVVIVARKNRRQ
jgi:hypothetical protein